MKSKEGESHLKYQYNLRWCKNEKLFEQRPLLIAMFSLIFRVNNFQALAALVSAVNCQILFLLTSPNINNILSQSAIFNLKVESFKMVFSRILSVRTLAFMRNYSKE